VTQADKLSKGKGPARGPLNLAAEIPKYLADADYRASAAGGEEDTANTADMSDSSMDEDEDDETTDDIAAEVLEQIDSAYEDGALHLSAGGDLNVATKDCKRPSLTRAAVGRFLLSEGKKAKVLYDVGRTLKDAVSEKVIQAAEAASSLSAVELDDLENNASTKERQEFWKLMGEVSTVSVGTNSYLEACEQLGIDPGTWLFSTDSKSFQPWQVISESDNCS